MDMKFDYDDSLKKIIECIESEKQCKDYRTMLYAADDFDDFIAFPKTVEVMKSSDLDASDKEYLKKHNAVQFAIIRCGKAFMRHNSNLEELEAKEALKNSITARQLYEELKKLEEHTLLRIMTENGRILFVIVNCKFNHISEKIAKDIGVESTFILEGNF